MWVLLSVCFVSVNGSATFRLKLEDRGKKVMQITDVVSFIFFFLNQTSFLITDAVANLDLASKKM
jgi:hypothetical protein